MSGHVSGSDWSCNDVDGNTPGVVGEWEIVTLGLNLHANSVGSELSLGWGPSEGSQLWERIASVAGTSVSSSTINLVRNGGSLRSGGESDGDSDGWVLQVLVIGDVVDDDLLSDVSVESLLVLWGWQVGVGGWFSGIDIVDDQSWSGIDTGGVTSGTVGIADTSRVGTSDAETIAESGSDLDVEEVIDRDPVSEGIGDDLLCGPVVLGQNLIQSDFTSSGVDNHAWGLGVTSTLLGCSCLSECQFIVFWIRSSDVVDVWNNVVINFEDWSKSSAWGVVWNDVSGNFSSGQSYKSAVDVVVTSVVVQSSNSAARRPSNGVVSSSRVRLGESPLGYDEIQNSVDSGDKQLWGS